MPLYEIYGFDVDADGRYSIDCDSDEDAIRVARIWAERREWTASVIPVLVMRGDYRVAYFRVETDGECSP